MPRVYDRESLAWAAGFFDGEGTICAQRREKVGNGSAFMNITIAVSQAGKHAPAILERFRSIVGVGNVYQIHGKCRQAHHKIGYSWRTSKFEYVQAVVALLWGWLGEQKREQAERELREYLSWPRQRMTPEKGRYMAARRWAHATRI